VDIIEFLGVGPCFLEVINLEGYIRGYAWQCVSMDCNNVGGMEVLQGGLGRAEINSNYL
jgi:hypothetical protein